MQGERYRLTQRGTCHRVRHASRQRNQHYAVAVRSLDLLLGRNKHDNGVSCYHFGYGQVPVGASPAGAVSTSTTSPTRTKSIRALSARCSGTMRAPGPAVDSASRLPSKRTSVSTSPRLVGLASVEPTTVARSACDPSEPLWPNAFRAEHLPASRTSPPAATRRASTVRVQSGRSDVEIRRNSVGFSDDSPTPQR